MACSKFASGAGFFTRLDITAKEQLSIGGPIQKRDLPQGRKLWHSGCYNSHNRSQARHLCLSRSESCLSKTSRIWRRWWDTLSRPTAHFQSNGRPIIHAYCEPHFIFSPI